MGLVLGTFGGSRKVRIYEKMDKNQKMEKIEVEKELSFLLERTLAWEDELNSIVRKEN